MTGLVMSRTVICNYYVFPAITRNTTEVGLHCNNRETHKGEGMKTIKKLIKQAWRWFTEPDCQTYKSWCDRAKDEDEQKEQKPQSGGIAY